MGAMPLHMTKVAFGAESVEHLRERLALRGEEAGGAIVTTRYLPKRHEEMVGGSLFWILKHQLVARSSILRFGEADGGRIAIHIDPVLVAVQARPKRAHQGWRYLEHDDAPVDLHGAVGGVAEMPFALVGKLTELALI